MIVDVRGEPAAGSLVSMFELIRFESPPGGVPGDEILKKRWIAETTADQYGRFFLSGPPRGRYEFVPAHPTRGRTVGERDVDGTAITLQLRSTPPSQVARAAWSSHFAGVAVCSVPDQRVFARATDPVAVLTPGAVTDEYGEFDLSLPEQGSGDVVIGCRGHATARLRFVDAESLPAVTDLGDIVLPPPAHLTVRLGESSCELYAVGPLGSLGMSRLRSTFDAQDRTYRFQLPESGLWWLEAMCGGEARPLAPSVVRVDESSTRAVVDATIATVDSGAP